MIKVKKVNAFTDSINGGNPAGVLLDSPDLTDEQMAFITKQLGVSETAFVFPSNKADYKVRFFSPNVEVDLCGHATIATFFTMALNGVFPQDKEIVVTQETKAGILPVSIYFSKGKVDKVMMTQGQAIYKNIHFDISKIAESLKIDAEEIDYTMPNQTVSTGLFTLPICIKSYDVLKNIKPDFDEVKNICNEINSGSFFLFSFETLNENSLYHARCFAPVYGVNEDPVTGTANGAVTSYLKNNKKITNGAYICEQGDIIGRSGRVYVELKNDVVKVGGKAKIVEEKEIKV